MQIKSFKAVNHTIISKAILKLLSQTKTGNMPNALYGKFVKADT